MANVSIVWPAKVKLCTRQARDIFVRRVELLDQRATQITLSVTCSKGTYIRTLGEDIGLSIRVWSACRASPALSCGPFFFARCLLTEYFTTPGAGRDCVRHTLIPVTEALSFLPSLMLTPQQYDDLCIRQGSALATYSGHHTTCASACFWLSSMYITTEDCRCYPAPIISCKDIKMEIVCTAIGSEIFLASDTTLAVFGG